MTSAKRRILIVTGETSGDLHGARLIRAAMQLNPDLSFFGIGGRRMADAGCEILAKGEDLAVIGLVEVLGNFPVIWRTFHRMKNILHGQQRPDALVLIDFPEFNLRLAKQAKRAGVPVLYYVSPQVWAWRRGRVKKIAAVVDRLAAIFPFEPELYEGLDIQVEYVGHPLLDEYFAKDRLQSTALADHLPGNFPTVGLFPGSRRSELKYMLGTLVETARQICSARPEVRFLVPVAAGLTQADIEKPFAGMTNVRFIETEDADIYEIARACHAVVSVSGTVTLQIALAGTPMAILYKLSPFTYTIGRKLIRVDYIGLANIVAGKQVVREFIQNEATPENLATEILRLMDDDNYARTVRSELVSVRDKLGAPGCSTRVARMLLDMLHLEAQES